MNLIIFEILFIRQLFQILVKLNIIIKGDVDGSVEALADSLIKLSQETVKVNVIHQAVGQIIESDVLFLKIELFENSIVRVNKWYEMNASF